MAGIPSSAIKFYTAPTGGTEVTSGSSNTTVYARIPTSFVETLTGSSVSVTFPYYGRTAISGIKTISCNSDTKNVSIEIPAYTGLFGATSGSGLGWSSAQVLGSDGVTWSPLTQILSLPKEASGADFSIYSNSKYVKLVDTNLTPADCSGFTVNGTIASEEFETTVENDVGRVCRYLINFSIEVTENSGLEDIDHGYISLYIGNTSGALTEYKIYVKQASQGVLLSDTEVVAAATNGYSSEPIVITSDSTFTVI